MVGLNKRESKELVESFFNEMNNTLANGEEIKLSGFGNFGIRDKNKRMGQNPKTGEDKVISARRVSMGRVTFKTGNKLKLKVESYNGKNV